MWYLNPTYKQRKAQNYAGPIRESLRKSFHENFAKKTKTQYSLKDNHLKNCNFFVGDVKQTQKYFDENSQDLILCRNVLYHLTHEDRQQVIAQFYSILKSEGLVCLDSDTYLETSWAMKKQGFVNPFYDKPWIYQKPKQKLDIEDIILNHQIEKLIKRQIGVNKRNNMLNSRVSAFLFIFYYEERT